MAKRAAIDTDGVLRELAGIALNDCESVDSVREVKTSDKLKALELCGKHLGMFKDGDKNNAGVTVVVNYDYGEKT